MAPPLTLIHVAHLFAVVNDINSTEQLLALLKTLETSQTLDNKAIEQKMSNEKYKGVELPKHTRSRPQKQNNFLSKKPILEGRSLDAFFQRETKDVWLHDQCNESQNFLKNNSKNWI